MDRDTPSDFLKSFRTPLVRVVMSVGIIACVVSALLPLRRGEAIDWDALAMAGPFLIFLGLGMTPERHDNENRDTD